MWVYIAIIFKKEGMQSKIGYLTFVQPWTKVWLLHQCHSVYLCQLIYIVWVQHRMNLNYWFLKTSMENIFPIHKSKVQFLISNFQLTKILLWHIYLKIFWFCFFFSGENTLKKAIILTSQQKQLITIVRLNPVHMSNKFREVAPGVFPQHVNSRLSANVAPAARAKEAGRLCPTFIFNHNLLYVLWTILNHSEME